MPIAGKRAETRRNHRGTAAVLVTITGGDNHAIVADRDALCSLLEVKNRTEWLNLPEKPFDKLRAHDFGKAWYIVNRLVRIKRRALTAGPITGFYEMALETEKPKLKDGKECDGSAADNDNIILRLASHRIPISLKA